MLLAHFEVNEYETKTLLIHKTKIMIKKLLLCGMAATMATQNLSAEMNYGLKAGGSMSYLSGVKNIFHEDTEKVSSGSRLFFTGGAFFNYAFTDNVGLGVEVNYMGLGGEGVRKPKDDKDNNNAKCASVKTTNLAMPVTFQYYPMGHSLEDGIFTIYAGGQPNFALGMNVEFKEGDDKEFKKDDEFKKEFKTGFSFDALAGIKYQLSIGLLFDIRYTHGFMSVFNDKDDTKEYMKGDVRFFDKDRKPLSLKNRCFSFTVGYSLASLMS